MILNLGPGSKCGVDKVQMNTLSYSEGCVLALLTNASDHRQSWLGRSIGEQSLDPSIERNATHGARQHPQRPEHTPDMVVLSVAAPGSLVG